MSQHAWPDTEPIEVHLAAGDAQLTVDLRGGGMSRLTVGTWDLLDSYPAGSVVEGWPGSVLLPWPNRVRFGRWAWRGRD
ncbi:MAG TPA: aldose epimerase, partial [Blastococcus sp.]